MKLIERNSMKLINLQGKTVKIDAIQGIANV